MSITSPGQFEKVRACGKIVGQALRAMAAPVRAGITTAELSEIGSRVLAEHGARSSPPLVYGFPGDVCISINDEVGHSIPGERVLQRGDLVKLDLTAELDGYHTDSAMSVEVPPRQQAKPVNWRVVPNARSGRRSAQRGRGIARKTSGAPSSAKCGGADFTSSKNSAATA
jgi:methionyl aminopeptidase